MSAKQRSAHYIQLDTETRNSFISLVAESDLPVPELFAELIKAYREKQRESIACWLPQINELRKQLQLFNDEYVASLQQVRDSSRPDRLELLKNHSELPVDSLLHRAFMIRGGLDTARADWENVIANLLAMKKDTE